MTNESQVGIAIAKEVRKIGAAQTWLESSAIVTTGRSMDAKNPCAVWQDRS
jgi:hypothetical protein